MDLLVRDLLAWREKYRQRGTDRSALSLLYDQPAHRASNGRLYLVDGLLALDLYKWLPLLHRLAWSLEPRDNLARFHRQPPFGHAYNRRHAGTLLTIN